MKTLNWQENKKLDNRGKTKREPQRITLRVDSREPQRIILRAGIRSV